MPHAKSNRLLGASKPMARNPECPVCSIHQVTVSVDLSRATLSHLVDDILRIELGYGDKEIEVSDKNSLLYAPDEIEHLPKMLSELSEWEE
jgi:ubiquitin-like 1-activating enzyme E1 B